MNKETKEAIERFLRHGNKRGGDFSPATVESYRADLEDFFNFVKKDFNQVTRRDCEDFEDFLKSKKKWENREAKKDERKIDVKSIYTKISAVKSFYRWVTTDEEYGIDKNPMNAIKIPTEKMRVSQSFVEKQILSREEVRMLLDATKNTRDNAILTVLYNTGIRIGELIVLEKNEDSVDMTNRVMFINGKGGKQRVVEFNDDVYNALKVWLLVRGEAESNALFTSKFGKKLDSIYINNMIKKQCKSIGITRRITAHSFRHTFITHAIEDGVLLSELASHVGHSSIDMTNSYVGISKLGNTIKTKFKGIHK
jgi:site-specific recombinase XerD